MNWNANAISTGSRHNVANAERLALEEGRRRGHEQGWDEGQEAGLEEGRKKELLPRIHFAQRVLKKPAMSDEELLRLSADDLAELANKLETEALSRTNGAAQPHEGETKGE
jgi:flagellar biosynthesis/type III secretory pathway protein FliH